MDLLPVVRSRDDAFAYACGGCGRCCAHKDIRVDPYAVARLADVLGASTTEVLERYVEPETLMLRQAEGGACVFYDGGCSVHPGRPLSCRLYPLGWTAQADGTEAFLELSAHPETLGVYGGPGTVADYLEAQGTAPYERASWRYAAVLDRLRHALADGSEAEARGPEPADGAGLDGAGLEVPTPPVLDVDAALEADAAATGERPPDGVEARVERHLALLHRWLDAAGAPPAGAATATG